MQNAALAAVGLAGWRYQLLPAPPELFEEIVRGLPAAGFHGVNVTIPHKAAALALADVATDKAQRIGAANTLLFPEIRDTDPRTGAARLRHGIWAENTDGPALVSVLVEHFRMPATGVSAVLLGAGGTARAALWALRDSGVADVRVWNRTPERARALCEELGGRAVTEIGPADLLINTTSVGLEDGDPFAALPLTAADLAGYGVVVDFVYTAGGTELVQAARTQGVIAVDGLELLVRQGAKAFELFVHRRAPLEVMRTAARGGG
jgi:shikimate dehydrogenase